MGEKRRKKEIFSFMLPIVKSNEISYNYIRSYSMIYAYVKQITPKMASIFNLFLCLFAVLCAKLCAKKGVKKW